LQKDKGGLMSRKNPEVTQETVRRLKEAFWGLYRLKPVEKISVREITDAAGYNHATFYLYFRNVRDVLDQIEDDLLNTRDRLFEAATGSGKIDLSGVFSIVEGEFLPYAKVLLGPHGDPAFERAAKERIWPYLEPLVGFPAIADDCEERQGLQVTAEVEKGQLPSGAGTGSDNGEKERMRHDVLDHQQYDSEMVKRELVKEFFLSGMLGVVKSYLAHDDVLTTEEVIDFIQSELILRQDSHR
jgi:AcrR family transcriptional regulator